MRIKLREKLEHYFFAPCDPFPFFILRITIGFIFLCHYISYFNDFIFIYSWKGLAGSYSYTPDLGSNFVYWTLYAVLLFSSLTTMIGYYSRTSLLIASLIHAYFTVTMRSAYWGWSYAVFYFCAITLISNPGAVWSLDLRLKKIKSLAVPAWKIKTVQLMMATFYFLVMMGRLGSPRWQDGSALIATLANVNLSRLAHWDLSHYFWLTKVLTYGTLVIEGLGALLMFLGPLQVFVASALFVLHVGAEFLLTVGYWQHLMAAALVSFFPQTWFVPAYTFLKSQKPKLQALKPKRIDHFIILIILVSWFILFPTSIKMNRTPEIIHPLQISVYRSLSPLGVNQFRTFNLLDFPNPNRHHCIAVLGFDGKWNKIFHSDLKNCFDSKFRVRAEPRTISLYILMEMQVRNVYNYTLTQRFNHLGEFFCQDAMNSTKRYSMVTMGLFSDLKPGYRNVTIAKHYNEYLGYDCLKRELLITDPERFLKAVNETLPEWISEFRKAGYPL